MTASVTVLETGLLTTVQDAGRPGQASLGVGRSGACDQASYRLANRLVGNAEGAAVLEVTYGGLRLRADGDVVVVTTGARCEGSWHHNAPTTLRAGDELVLGVPTSGLRTYVAVRGGFDVDPVLGSCATDTLSGLGPDVLSPGDVLAVGTSEPADARRRPGPGDRPGGPGRDRAGDARAAPGLVPRRGVGVAARAALDGHQRQQPGRAAARGRGRSSGTAPTSCPARAWSAARCRCRRPASRCSSWPTIR